MGWEGDGMGRERERDWTRVGGRSELLVDLFISSPSLLHPRSSQRFSASRKHSRGDASHTQRKFSC